LYEGWRAALIRAAAWIEAAIDFSDEEIPADALTQAKMQVAELAQEMRAHLNDARRGEILREGFRLTVIGPPNSGKSSLINALTRRDVAIVSEIAGTTRDVLEAHLDLGGYPVIVADTAGLRETSDAVETEGVRRALARAEAADAVLLLLDTTNPDARPQLQQSATLTVWNKMDVAEPPQNALGVSVRTGEGMDQLLLVIRNIVQERLSAKEAPFLTRERHRHALGKAVVALEDAWAAEAPEIIAEEMRVAIREIGRVTGGVDVEDLLDVVFRDFCVGK
jgi:tRNA modification GTPase